LLPSDEAEWIARLQERAEEQGEDVDMDIRITKVKEELETLASFNYAVVNADGKLHQTVDTILAIVTAEHHKLDHFSREVVKE